MKDIDNLCAKCFDVLTEGAVCANCGYDNDNQNDSFCLPAKTIIGRKYAVGAFEKRESDAVSYNGFDMELNKKIIIREYCPVNYSNRLEGSTDIHVRQKFIEDFKKNKQNFIKLWQTMQKLQSLSAVVPVYDVFEENGTAYAIIEEIEAIPLREYLLRNENGYIKWENARIMFMPVLTTLEALHEAGIIHGSITPDSLLLCRDGKVRLSPFTIQQCCDARTTLEFNHTDGYTALEQYDNNNHKMCAATDIYSFSACIYRALVGTNPPDAVSREANDKLMIPNSIAEGIPIHVIKTLSSSLQVYPEKRIRSIEAFREELDASPNVQAKAAEPMRAADNMPKQPQVQPAQKEYAQDKPKKNGKSKVAIVILCILIVAAVAAGIFVIKNSEQQNQPEEPIQNVQMEQYEVPNFINTGFTQSDIENNAAWNEQFEITYVYEYSTEVEEGLISAQSVKAGEKINRGSNITLTVSKGVQTEVIPNVGGLMLDDAKQRLEELGFKVSSVEVYNDGTHIENQLKARYATAPANGEVVAVGSEVIIQVYGAPPVTTEPENEIPPMEE